jgi:hypothetical protein
MAEFRFDLQPEGNADSTYHTLDAFPGQVERANVYDYGSALNMQMNLVDVIHGTMSPEGLPATLVIADFQFISHEKSRRLPRANNEFRFRDLDPNDANPPEVFAIAPQGSFSMNQTEKTQELKRAAKADVGAAFVANVTTGLEWSLTETQTKYSAARLTGIMTMKDRKREPRNVAKWSLEENERDEKGIPSLLRAAILLRRRTYERFLASIALETKIDWKTHYNLETRKGGGDIDPVTFDPSRTRTTPVPAYIDPTNLGFVNLDALAAVQSVTSIQAAPAIQANVLTGGQRAGLSLENVMQTASKPEAPVQKPAVEPGTDAGAVSRTDLGTGPAMGLGSDSGPGSGLQFGSGSGSLPRTLGLGAETSLEETMRLLLHAVRKGVEVIAEAVNLLVYLLTFPLRSHHCMLILCGTESNNFRVLA